MERYKVERNKPRTLSPVPEEREGDEDAKVSAERGESKEKLSVISLSSDSEEEDDEAMPLEIDVHGLKANVYLNCADVDVVPARYLEKADRSAIIKRVPWIFRAAKDGREVNLSKWSKVDIRFRGVFKTLKNVPSFTKGLFEHESGHMSSSKGDFEKAVTAQGQVVYALLEEVLNMLQIKREAEDHTKFFFLRPRLISCQTEYWIGYRVKYRDTPPTAGSVMLDFDPPRAIVNKAVVPVVTTTEIPQSIKASLNGEYKLLLAQLLVNVHRLAPPGDKIPDQEAFLISLHGSRLHILRGVFPGQKTSKLWSGRHNPSELDIESKSTHAMVSKMSDRFYSRLNLERFMEEVEWNQLSCPDNESNPKAFQILGSREYDLWMKWEFAAAVRLLAGLMMYLMSGQARCGVLQDVFADFPYDEGLDPESEDENENAEKEQKYFEEEEKKLMEQEKQKEEEEKANINKRDAMRSSVRDKIGGLTEGFRKPWYDWVWEEKHNEGRPKEDLDHILNPGGPC
ncbi:hypothetical protein BJY04DRAFT_230807 [Aspergillus karnatakaensis]|uniref:uncharacterized protein n=1 Tax=Aspergillus karnatakaensis TaxID=1810916 RepID=UPI003CCCB3BF